MLPWTTEYRREGDRPGSSSAGTLNSGPGTSASSGPVGPSGSCQEEEIDFADPTQPPPFEEFPDNVMQEVYVINSKSPSSFKLQLGAEANVKAITEMQKAMTAFYDNYYFKNKIWLDPTKAWQQAFYATYVPRLKTWARCWVENLLGSSEAEVQLLDYGLSEIVPARYLLPLRPEYLKLPVQAYLGKLALLAEPPHTWTAAESQDFCSDWESNPGYALIKGTETKFPPYLELSVVLFYAEQDQDGVERRRKLYDLDGVLDLGYGRRQADGAGSETGRRVRFEV